MDRSAVESLLGQIDEALSKSVTAIAIGGAAMVIRGQKPETVDVDFIALTEDDRNILTGALENLGFSRKLFGTRFEHPDGRRVEIDVGGFLQTPLSERMKMRANSTGIEFEKLQLSLLSNEDVIFYKAMTERGKDVRDIINILSRARVDWGTVLDEAEKLSLEKRDTIYPTFVAEKLQEVKNAGGPVDEEVVRKFEDLGVKLYETVFEKRVPITISDRTKAEPRAGPPGASIYDRAEEIKRLAELERSGLLPPVKVAEDDLERPFKKPFAVSVFRRIVAARGEAYPAWLSRAMGEDYGKVYYWAYAFIKRGYVAYKKAREPHGHWVLKLKSTSAGEEALRLATHRELRG